MQNKFDKIQKIVEKELACSAHNIDHVMRVFALCKRLAKNEKVDIGVIKASALLHDIARAREDNDKMRKIDHAILGAEMAEEILLKLKFSRDKINHIKDCILSHRHRSNRKPESLEAKILCDADKLDAIGAIGIGRAFVWAGRNNANFHKKIDIEKYKKNNFLNGGDGIIKNKEEHSPWLEYEIKLKRLKNLLYLEKSKKIAEGRDKFMADFFKRLEKESKGEL